MLILYGCAPKTTNTTNPVEVPLVVKEPKHAQLPPPQPPQIPQDLPQPNPTIETPNPPETTIPSDNVTTEENISNPLEVQSSSTCLLNETNHTLCNLPKEKLSPNPQNLDTTLYSIFRNVIDGMLSRHQGTITVSTTNPNGIGMQEFTFDITNAIEEKGIINPKKEIEASLETLHTLQKSMGYGSSTRENFREYKSYVRIRGEIISPFMGDIFTLENLVSLQSTEENDEISIIATFTQKATDLIHIPPDNGSVNIVLNITKNAELNSIKVEQYSPKETISTAEYTFS